MIKCIVAGGRDFNDYKLLCNYLDFLFSKTDEEITIISGTSKGADKLGEWYANHIREYPLEKYPANWDLYGESAGYRRNKQMAFAATHCVCFWDGKSRGTKHMIDLATQMGLVLRVKKY